MSENDASQAFLESLPEVKPGERFQFACHPQVRCFNACCADLNLMLTPYDVLRLRRGLARFGVPMTSRDFIAAHAHVGQAPDTGFPALALVMAEGAGKPCPFVRHDGCSVYANRPGACRTYPIGRASKLGPDGGIVEQFFLVKERHCVGFLEDRHWDLDGWLSDQGLAVYNDWNDRYVRLLARQKTTGQPIDNRRATMVLMALYQLDSFQKFVKDMGLFKRLEVSEERQNAILEDEEAALGFALQWVELVLFGACDGLRAAP